MPTNFPVSLDSFSNPGPETSMNAPGLLHNEQHSNLNDAVEALQAKVGVNGSADATSLEYKLNNLNDEGIAEDQIWDAGGDLVVGSGANSAVKLSKGAALTYLRVNGAGSTLEWGSFTDSVASKLNTMLTGNTVSGITVTYQGADQTIDFAVTNSPALNGQNAAYYLSTDNHTSGTNNKVYTTAEQTKLSGIANSATANATNAQLRDTDTHTDGVTNGVFTLANRTKLNGIATGATNNATLPVEIGLSVSDETTTITTGTGKLTFRMPHAMTVTSIRANVNTVSSSGVITVDVKENGSTIMTTTKVTIAQGSKTSVGGTPAVITDASLADDSEITIDITGAGTGAKGLKLWLIGTRAA